MAIQNPSVPTLYKYERFGPYIFTFPDGYQVFGNPLSNYRDGTFACNSSVLQQYCYYDPVGSNVVFGGSNYPNGIANATSAAGELLEFRCQLSGSTQIASNSPLIVVVGNGRFTFGFGTLSDQKLYVGQVYTDVIELKTANLSVSTVYSSPSLPLGMSFVQGSNGTQWFINGTPQATYAKATYKIIGTNAAGNVVTATMTFQVVGPRISVLAPSPLLTVYPASNPVSYMITASGNALVTPGQFAFVGLPAVPDGCFFYDPTKPPPFIPLATGSTLSQVQLGLSTTGTARGAQGAIGSGTFTANLRSVAGSLSNTTAIQFSYTETVLFVGSILDGATLTGFYTGVTVPRTYLLSALSFFPGNAASANIDTMSGTLPPGLSITFNKTLQQGFITGTPTVAGTSTATITATNTNEIVGEMTVTIVVETDTVVVTPLPGAAYTFTVGRSISLDTAIAYTATSGAGLSISSFTSSALPSGVSASKAGSVLTLQGTPVTPSPSTLTTVTATDTFATGTSTFTVTVVDDTFTFDTVPTIELVQNTPMVPVRVRVNSTASGLSILSYSSLDMPLGLTLTSGGYIQGTPLVSGTLTATVTATTGYSSGTPYTVHFSIQADSLLFLLPNGNSYTWSNGLTFPVNAISYSEVPGSNFTLSSPAPYGFTITSGGTVGGTLTDSLPPHTVLPPTTTITIGATAGGLTDTSLQFTVTTQNALIGRTYVTTTSGLYASDSISNTFANPGTWTRLTSRGLTDFKMKNASVDSNVFLAVGSSLYRSTDGNTFTTIPVALTKVDYDGTNWYGAFNGTVYVSADGVTWTVLATIPPGTVNALRASNGVVYVGTANDLYRYPNRYGELVFEPEVIGKTNAINIDVPGSLLAGCDGGLFFSDNGGFGWSVVEPIAGLSGAVGVNSEIVYGNGTFAFIGGTSVFYSTNPDVLFYNNWSRDTTTVLGPLGYTPATGWSVADATTLYQTPGFPASWTPTTHGLTLPGPVLSTTQYIRPPGTTSFVTTLTRAGGGTGPVFTSPSTVVYFYSLYLKIPTIHFHATGTNPIYYFLDQTTLPIGFEFDPLAQTITGTPMRILHSHTLTIFAKDGNGYISSVTLTLSVRVPYAGLPDLGNASSYTAYLRDQVVINGAVRAIGSEVYPGAAVGPLMGPSPSPEVVNTIVCCDPPK